MQLPVSSFYCATQICIGLARTCYGNVAGWVAGWLAGWLSHAGIVSIPLNLS